MLTSISRTLFIRFALDQYHPHDFQSPFIQEGTPPATGKWMEIVNTIFEEYKDWILLIHGNMLVLAHTPNELFEKIKLIV
jgi:hypothetical protein